MSAAEAVAGRSLFRPEALEAQRRAALGHIAGQHHWRTGRSAASSSPSSAFFSCFFAWSLHAPRHGRRQLGAQRRATHAERHERGPRDAGGCVRWPARRPQPDVARVRQSAGQRGIE